MTLDSLRAALSGTVVAPGDPDWDSARAFHSGTGEPDLVVRVASVSDVAVAVTDAAADGRAVLVRSGGHSGFGEIPGGTTIDLAELDAIEVDDDLVRVGGGATWGSVARALAEHGLALSSGDTASVGVGGLTLGGGIGWMVRAWGLAADQLVGVQLVTAAGDIVEADDESHPELMWGLRGGGGNFGVVTRFDFRAHRLARVVHAAIAVTGDARPVLRALRDVLAEAPRELTVTYMDVPPMDPSGPAGAGITACWAGDDEAAARVALAPLWHADGATLTELRAVAYPDILLETPPADPDQPMPGFVGGNALVVDLDDDLIDALADFRESHAASVLFLRSLGGAFGEVASDATPFPSRDATWFVMAGAFDIPGVLDDAARVAATAAWDAIERRGDGVYGNFAVLVDPSVVAMMYPPAVLARLSRLKAAWDPANVFSRNHNVTPDTADAAPER
ncbi:FAD-binding oxidoreductase [Microbacterium awajiense]|uniref:FAD-binding oxidoreductase n=1 Tax=Microbacterium awajiense TaxID=415214 RepID=A0ABP7ABQ7_9MICO